MYRCGSFLAVGVLTLALALPAGARQREYTVGLGLNMVSGGDSHLGTSSLGEMRFFYGAYPSISMLSEGALSTVDLSYAYGVDRTETTPRLETQSHSAVVRWSKVLGTRGRFNVSDSFRRTSDIKTLNVFLAIPTDPDGFDFLFEPVTSDRSALTNNARFGLAYSVTPQSTLEFSAGHAVRDYASDIVSPSLSDQQRASGGVAYRRRLSTRSSLTAGYSAVHLDFAEFDNSVSHAGRLTYTREVAPELTFILGGGPTYVTSRGMAGSYLGFNANASLRKELENSLISVFFSAQSGESSGLGGTSDTRRLGASMTQVSRLFTLFVDGSAVDSRGRLGTTERFRGFSGSATIGFPLAENWSVEGGFRYQRYSRTAEFAATQERVFASIRYNDPDVLRFLR